MAENNLLKAVQRLQSYDDHQIPKSFNQLDTFTIYEKLKWHSRDMMKQKLQLEEEKELTLQPKLWKKDEKIFEKYNKKNMQKEIVEDDSDVTNGISK